MKTIESQIELLLENYSALLGVLEGAFEELPVHAPAYLDTFALIPKVEVAVLCSSSHDSRPVNRVIYSLAGNIFNRYLKPNNYTASMSAVSSGSAVRWLMSV